MSMREDLMAKQAELVELNEQIEAGDADACTKGAELMTEIKELEGKIETADRASEMVKSIGKPVENQEDETMEVKEAKNLGENFVETVKSAQIGEKFDVVAKAYNSVQTSPSATEYATTFDRNVVEAARTPLVIRDLFNSETISGSMLVYLVEDAIEGAPAVVAEAGKKPQVHFKDPAKKTVSLSKIACFIKESDEYIADYPFLASAINGRLLYELGLVEQNKLIYWLKNTSGIQTDTTSWTGGTTATGLAELILDAAMDVQGQSGFAADGVVINPADWYSLRIAKANGTGEYFGGGFFGQQQIPDLWGIPVCVSTAVTAGQVIVGAFKTCGSVVQNGGVAVEAVNTNEDDFIYNLMTIRAEERIALAVRRPAGFKVLTKQGVSA